MANNVQENLNGDSSFFDKQEGIFVHNISSELEQLLKQEGRSLTDRQKLEENLKKIYGDSFSKPFHKEALKEDLKELLNLLKEFNQEIFYILALLFHSLLLLGFQVYCVVLYVYVCF